RSPISCAPSSCGRTLRRPPGRAPWPPTRRAGSASPRSGARSKACWRSALPLPPPSPRPRPGPRRCSPGAGQPARRRGSRKGDEQARKPPGIQKGGRPMLTLEKAIALKAAVMFAEAPEEVLADIAAIVEEVEVAAGETVIAKGEAGDSMYLIVEGQVRVHDGD